MTHALKKNEGKFEYYIKSNPNIVETFLEDNRVVVTDLGMRKQYLLLLNREILDSFGILDKGKLSDHCGTGLGKDQRKSRTREIKKILAKNTLTLSRPGRDRDLRTRNGLKWNKNRLKTKLEYQGASTRTYRNGSHYSIKKVMCHNGKAHSTQYNKQLSNLVQRNDDYYFLDEYVCNGNQYGPDQQNIDEMYDRYRFRKHAMHTYTRHQLADHYIVKRIEQKFNTKEYGPVTHIIGNHVQTSPRKGWNSYQTVGYRKNLKRNGHEVYTLDEYNTSKLCCQCTKELKESFKSRNSKKPKKYGTQEKAFGLKCCINCGDIAGKRVYFDRDNNAVFCMCRILYFMSNNNGDKPEAFEHKKRKNNIDDLIRNQTTVLNTT